MNSPVSFKIISASHLRDGIAVRFGHDDHWTDNVAEAAFFTEDTLAKSLAATNRPETHQVVVDIHDVTISLQKDSTAACFHDDL